MRQKDIRCNNYFSAPGYSLRGISHALSALSRPVSPAWDTLLALWAAELAENALESGPGVSRRTGCSPP